MSVITDPELTEPERKPGTSPRVYFSVDAGASYTVVARDRAHAEQILRESSNEWYDENGDVVPFDRADASWSEISAERAAQIRVYTDDGCTGPFPLNTFEPGDWFTSEY